MAERILLFALEELRIRYGHLVPEGVDPRHDTAAFRAFRGALLQEMARTAAAPAELSMWWEGTYNGYFLAVSVAPPDALGPGFDPDAACPADGERIGAARTDGCPLASVAPGRADVARDAEGATYEAPFGAPTGHFGAPGMRRVT